MIGKRRRSAGHGESIFGGGLNGGRATKARRLVAALLRPVENQDLLATNQT